MVNYLQHMVLDSLIPCIYLILRPIDFGIIINWGIIWRVMFDIKTVPLWRLLSYPLSDSEVLEESHYFNSQLRSKHQNTLHLGFLSNIILNLNLLFLTHHVGLTLTHTTSHYYSIVLLALLSLALYLAFQSRTLFNAKNTALIILISVAIIPVLKTQSLWLNSSHITYIIYTLQFLASILQADPPPSPHPNFTSSQIISLIVIMLQVSISQSSHASTCISVVFSFWVLLLNQYKSSNLNVLIFSVLNSLILDSAVRMIFIGSIVLGVASGTFVKWFGAKYSIYHSKHWELPQITIYS